jgi:hypothetical protein
MTTVWSCGGGTQSAAIAALIVTGRLPKPDAAVIADTGREASATWSYYDAVLRPNLAAVGVDLVRLPHSFKGKGWNTVDWLGGADGKTVLPPMFTTHTGKIGQTSKFCSNEWKARPCERYYRSLGLKEGSIWIGFSNDELQRMRGFNPRAKWNHEYPLIDLAMSRTDCIDLVAEVGWSPPPRSSCWMCPYRSDAEWADLPDDDFNRAVAFDKDARAIDPTLFLHRSGVPLDEVQFDTAKSDLHVEQCASGMCFT